MILGYSGMPPYHDHKKPTSPELDFATVLAGREQHTLLPFDVAGYFRSYPHDSRGLESFLSWSKNVASGAREVVSISHVTMIRCGGTGDRVALISAQIYASHYLDASLSYTVLPGEGDDSFLLDLRRTRIDVIRGVFGGVIRNILEDQIRYRIETFGVPQPHRHLMAGPK